LYSGGGQSDWAKVFAEIRDMKTQRNHRPISGRLSEKCRFTKHLAEFWHDLQDEQHWKYESSSPVQILEQLNLDTWQQNNDVAIMPQIPSGFGQNRGILFFAQDTWSRNTVTSARLKPVCISTALRC
jgi:hypothetical protein